MNHEDKCRIDRLEARIHQLECASIPEPDREPDKVPQESQEPPAPPSNMAAGGSLDNVL